MIPGSLRREGVRLHPLDWVAFSRHDSRKLEAGLRVYRLLEHQPFSRHDSRKLEADMKTTNLQITPGLQSS